MPFIALRLIPVLTFLLLGMSAVCAQDTLRVMHYNVLRYGDSQCDKTNEDEHFKAIIDHYKPDIMTVNELEPNETYAQSILSRVLNTNGRSGYKKAKMTNHANSGIVNMVFYNSDKLALASQDVSNTMLRDINHYRLFYKAEGLGNSILDTVFLNVSTMHLKAGSDNNDRQTRDQMTRNMMDHIEQKAYDGHYVATGDFNIRSSSGPGYQNLVNPGSGSLVDFVDPVDEPGNWHKNAAFSNHHTQSTRTDYIGDCGVPGGMDDRFDFILLSDKTMNGQDQIHYVPGSYKAGGQDGNRFDQGILNPENQEVSSSLANSLKQMSDHLPVMLDLKVDQDQNNTNVTDPQTKSQIRIGPNPFDQTLQLTFPTESQGQLTLQQASGNQVLEQPFSGQKINLKTSQLGPGLYILKIRFQDKFTVYRKLIKT